MIPCVNCKIPFVNASDEQTSTFPIGSTRVPVRAVAGSRLGITVWLGTVFPIFISIWKPAAVIAEAHPMASLIDQTARD
jgi:hypothetical protein